MRFLIVFLFCISMNAQIPNTAGGWGLDNVRTYIGLSMTASLEDCFAAADPSCFDPTYEGSKDRLSNFRNYDCSLSTFAHDLAFDGSSSSSACDDYPYGALTFYTDNSTWVASSQLYNDSAGTVLASAGYYTHGILWRYWNGTDFTTAGGCGSLVAISLGYNGTDSAAACSYYPNATKYSDGYTWSGATVLYNDSAGTVLASAGYYSDGVFWRYWNGTDFTTAGGCGSLVAISLGYNGTDSAAACSYYPNITMYIKEANLAEATYLYENPLGTSFAPSGYYTDGTTWRYWVEWRYWVGALFTTSGECL